MVWVGLLRMRKGEWLWTDEEAGAEESCGVYLVFFKAPEGGVQSIINESDPDSER